LKDVHRCSHLAAWAAALGWELLGDGRLKARVQTLQGCLLAEELYPSRLTYGWREPSPQASLLLLQHGRCIAESGGAPLLLRADGRNVGLLPVAAAHRLTVSKAPCRLVRIVLPPGSSHPGPGPWHVDLALMLPMLRLLEQALRHPGGEERRGELGATLLGYLLHQLAVAGCGITLAVAGNDPAADSHTDAALLPRLEHWLAEHLEDPLQLADLAAAMAFSPRRLQELCRQQAGCTPMELVRRLRLEALAARLRDPRHQGATLASLMAALQLPNSAATRHTFARLFGMSPADYHRKPMAAR
jgi:AraC-like DNA-binding protein